ncbi:histone-lysine N-methyltransferase SETMAR [Trichonephila clavipes]|nr:histone-lysine N-methyltransferase SETMAR [Trichonephila clavipes]
MEWRRTSSPIKVKAQDCGNSVLGPALCFADATRNNGQLRCLLRHSTEALKGIAKQTVWHAVKRCFAPLRPHISRTTWELIESFGWEVLDYAPYSPDLAPSDLYLFRYLKPSLGGKHLSDNEEVKATVNSWLFDQAAGFDEGFQNLDLRYDKCINKLGNYVEK